MFSARGIGQRLRSLKNKLCLSHLNHSYAHLPAAKERGDAHLELAVPKGFVPMIVGDVEGREGKKYVIRVEYLSTPSFKRLFNKLWEENEFELEAETKGPIKLPCTVEAFEQELKQGQIHESH